MSDGGAQWKTFGPFFNSVGVRYTGIKVDVLAAGTTNNKTYWEDEDKTTAGAHPLVDSDGDGIVGAFFDGDYRFRVKDSSGVVLDVVVADLCLRGAERNREQRDTDADTYDRKQDQAYRGSHSSYLLVRLMAITKIAVTSAAPMDASAMATSGACRKKNRIEASRLTRHEAMTALKRSL